MDKGGLGMENQVQYITSREGLKSVLSEILQEFNLIKPEEELPKPPATRKEAAQYLNISLPTLDTLLDRGSIASFKIGRQVRINWIDLEGYVRSKNDINKL